MTLYAGIWLTILSIEDVWKRKLSVYILLLGCLFLWAHCWIANEEELKSFLIESAIAMLPGVLLLGIAAVSDQVGSGDGMAVAILGPVLGGDRIWIVILSGLFCMSVFSAALLIARKASKSSKIPFLPFLLAGWLFTVFVIGGGAV